MSEPEDLDSPELAARPSRPGGSAGPPSRASRFRKAAPPSLLRLELVGHCDPGCAECAAPFKPGAEPPAFMEWELLTRLLEQLPKLERLRLEGVGEPMRHPRFFDAVAHAVAKGVRVSASTGLADCDEAGVARLAGSGLEHLEVAVDGATRETFEALRAPARFSRVLRNLSELRRVKERLGAARPTVAFVATAVRENLAELPALVRLARRLGVARVVVRNLAHDFSEATLSDVYRPIRDWVRAQALSREDPERVRRHFSRAREASVECGVDLRLPGSGGAGRCREPWDGLSLSWRGIAMPCGMLAVPERARLGDAAADGAASVWNGEDFGEFREALASDAPPDVCRGCALYRGIL